MIERVTNNYRRIKRLAPDWNLTVSDQVFYLVEMENGDDIGVMVFHPCDQDGLLMHVELGYRCRGALALRSGRDALEWIFKNTGHEKIHGEVPGHLRQVCRMVREIGAKFDGIERNTVRCYSIGKQEFHERVVKNG